MKLKVQNHNLIFFQKLHKRKKNHPLIMEKNYSNLLDKK